MKTAIVVSLMAACGLAPLAAQQAPITRTEISTDLTLEDAIGIALQNNGSYTRLLNDAEVNEAARHNAFTRMLPIPGGNLSTGLGPSRSTSPFGTTTSSSSNTSVNFGLSLNVWDGGSALNQYRQSKMQIEQSEINRSAQEITLRANVITQYYQAQQAQRAVELERRLLAARRIALKDTELKFRRAMLSPIDMRRAEQSVLQYENTVLNAEDNLTVAKLNLLGTMGISAQTDFSLTTPLPDITTAATVNEEEVVALALAQNPSIRTQTIALERSAMTARISRRSRFMPSVRLSANFGRGVSESGYAAFLDPTARNTSMSGNLGVSFSFNQLLDFTSTSYRDIQESASLEDSESSLRDARQAIDRQVRVAVINLRAAYRTLEYANAALENARVQASAANDQLSAGAINYFNYQDIMDGLSDAERNLLTQQFNVLNRRIALDQLLGNRPGG